MLVGRDIEAFARRDWGMVDGDFDRERFEGVMAGGSSDPREWKISYPDLEAYRDDWLKGAEDYAKMPLAHTSHGDLMFKMTTFDHIEISGDRALCAKSFDADEALKGGERYKVASQTLYRLQRVRGEWKIVGFIGDLPVRRPPAPQVIPVAVR
jgi:hypothetical protein